MVNYIFLAIFIIIFTSSFFCGKENRGVSFVLVVNYVIYIFFINPVESDKFYYILVTLLDACAGFYLLLIYHGRYYLEARYIKYIAYLSFISVFVHIYGRIIYGLASNTEFYVNLCVLIVVTQILLMSIRAVDDGIYRYRKGNFNLYFNNLFSAKCNTKFQVRRIEKRIY